ncbi:uncharacterized protein BO97DRAFT_402575 [Aspergillus homomorphus CBS 101889]|uniref:Uncharacterized protein n=1 Tax=Aspergillus homomorphus (strain CBS 101889) TaxID=1450537 RepID=A0A395ICW4_ASPHC|nr:hypothetical protein BO97DRAFT_402575 [Aspergillus homomorphus CBS 101889]RAL17013.1 hypothetical protein BO97DRAFT_402575 [Aspergillus homomorphus CBS 101889]
MSEYARSIAQNEMKWAQAHVQPKINVQLVGKQPETADDYILLLERHLELVPFLIQDPLGHEPPNQLLYSDLLLDNIFVDPSINITAVIDWQHTVALPVDQQQLFPQMLEPTSAGAGEGDDSLCKAYLTKVKSLSLRR